VAKNIVLRKLNLAGNRFGDAGAKALAAMLMHNQALVELDLTGTDISEEGGQALLSALRANSALVSLNLMWNDVEPETMKEIGDMLAQKAPKYNREPLSDEGPKRSLHSSRTTMHEDVDVETDDLELLALQEKERSFKSTVEKETKDAEKSSHWEPPGGSPAGGFTGGPGGFQLPKGYPKHVTEKLQALFSKLQNREMVGPEQLMPAHSSHTEL
jgi:Ran GTPase-activating protein (RanGAP) involved in mRNA processing and transport